MEKVNVLIVPRLGLPQNYMKDIAAVDSRISVKDGTEQFIAELRRKGRKGLLVERLEREASLQRSSQLPQTQEDLDTLLVQAEVIYGTILFPDDLLSRAPKLKWLHIGNPGIDRFLQTGIFDGKAVVTTGRGTTATSVAEHAITFVFMLAKNAPRFVYNKQSRQWDQFVTMELHNRTLGIIGLGAIGSEVARLAKGIGMRVIATRRSATRRESNVLGVDELYPRSELGQMLSQCDFVVIAVPITPETKRMVGEKELRAMKPSAYLINVARGQIVDQAALIKALKEGWIAGAGLDVFDAEPLPTASDLWQLPNVILSSHIAASSDKRSQHILELFCDNLRQYLAGAPLLNVVDKRKGY
ncbi:MAG: D-2-hydroxyacid dehydrogenase [Chloroflexi bacterium]|nr:D-2-hydroxyacid dehydrogenase [Chloroflexota bacterium]